MRFRHSPGHHVAHAGPFTPAHQETHSRVCDGVPGPAHKQDDGGIEGIQLEGGNGEGVKRETKTKRTLPHVGSSVVDLWGHFEAV